MAHICLMDKEVHKNATLKLNPHSARFEKMKNKRNEADDRRKRKRRGKIGSGERIN